MGVFGEIFKQSGSMQATVKKNMIAGRIYPTGQGPTPEEVKKYEVEQASRRMDSDTEKAKKWVEEGVAEALWSFQNEASKHNEEISTIFANPFKADVLNVSSNLYALEQWLFDLAQALKTERVQLRTDADVQPAVDFIADYLLSHGCHPVGGFGQDLMSEYGIIRNGLNFQTVVVRKNGQNFGMCRIHAFETQQDKTGKNPTWRVWYKGCSGMNSKSTFSEEVGSCIAQVRVDALHSEYVNRLIKTVNNTFMLKVLNGVSDGDRATLRSLGGYFTYKLGIPVEVVGSKAYLEHLRETVGINEQTAMRTLGEHGGHYFALTIPAAIFNPAQPTEQSIPGLIKMVCCFNDQGKLVDVHDTLLRSGHYKDDLDLHDMLPKNPTGDPKLSRTNLYIGLA